MKTLEIVQKSIAYGAQQIEGEFNWLLEKILLLEHRKTAVEIGVMSGGTYYAFTQLFDCAIGIDITKHDLPFLLEKHHQYIIGNSKSQAIISHIDDIDFLFIDGDHSYPGVSEDFYLWQDKVRKGGLIAFHDIQGANINGREIYGVRDFWRKIKSSYKTEEVTAREKDYGIGIIWK